MVTTCEDCGKTFDDVYYRVICPHEYIPAPKFHGASLTESDIEEIWGPHV